jgi:hypothetical protein
MSSIILFEVLHLSPSSPYYYTRHPRPSDRKAFGRQTFNRQTQIFG